MSLKGQHFSRLSMPNFFNVFTDWAGKIKKQLFFVLFLALKYVPKTFEISWENALLEALLHS